MNFPFPRFAALSVDRTLNAGGRQGSQPFRESVVSQVGRSLRDGSGTAGAGMTGRPRAWTLRSDMLSPRYTTEWDDLLLV
ncbi:MAG TPA: DUF4113 domain-containing protein [Terriglobales bacterium]|nr:DUF4113 domain-containing protein [Terriglobales bacterium]